MVLDKLALQGIKDAAEIIKKFNMIFGFKINTSELEKQAKDFEKKLNKVLKHAKNLSSISMDEKPSKIYG